MRLFITLAIATMASARFNGTGVCQVLEAGVPPNVPNPMFPDGMTLGTGSPPFNLTAGNVDEYTAGKSSPINITIPAGNFRGILLYATKSNNASALVGTWLPQEGYLLCPGNTSIVHEQASNRTGPVTFQFIPPATDVGTIAFHAFIAEGGAGRYWHLDGPISLESAASSSSLNRTNTTNTTNTFNNFTSSANFTNSNPITSTQPPRVIPLIVWNSTNQTNTTTTTVPYNTTTSNRTVPVVVPARNVTTMTNRTVPIVPAVTSNVSAPRANRTVPIVPRPTLRPTTVVVTRPAPTAEQPILVNVTGNSTRPRYDNRKPERAGAASARSLCGMLVGGLMIATAVLAP